jgi:chromate transporter
VLYITLFLEFFKIGLFSVGGGLATLPFLQELIVKYGWITKEELLNLIAIAESTPGPIGVNAATFVGYNTAGIMGGIIATLGLVTPSIIIIVFITHFFSKFYEHSFVRGAFWGIRPAVTGLIASVVFGLGKTELLNYRALLLFLLMFLLINRYKKHPIIYLFIAAIIGIVFRY